jgi:hypothetical protein
MDPVFMEMLVKREVETVIDVIGARKWAGEPTSEEIRCSS